MSSKLKFPQDSNIRYWIEHFEGRLTKNTSDPVKILDFSNEKLMNQIHCSILEAIRFNRLLEESNILDAGCGTSNFLVKFIKKLGTKGKNKIYAIDISHKMLSEASAHLDEHIEHAEKLCRFMKMTVDNMQFSNDFFDLSIASETLQYVDPYRGLLELIRVTKKGGQVVVSVPNQESPVIKNASEKHEGKYQGLIFPKAHSLIKDNIKDLRVKPLIFSKIQDEKPYNKVKFKANLSKKELALANRFIININL